MRDRDIRDVLQGRLSAEHQDEPDTCIVQELGLCQGDARVDVAVVNGVLTGYEIKSEKDTLERLPRQIEAYNRVFDYVTIVTGEKHAAKVKKAVPRWWGIEVARYEGDQVVLKTTRPPSRNAKVDAFSRAQLLWREEALLALEERELATGLRSKPRQVLWRALASQLDGDDLSELVRATLKSRTRWRPDPAAVPGDATSTPSSTT